MRTILQQMRQYGKIILINQITPYRILSTRNQGVRYALCTHEGGRNQNLIEQAQNFISDFETHRVWTMNEIIGLAQAISRVWMIFFPLVDSFQESISSIPSINFPRTCSTITKESIIFRTR